MAPRTAIVTGAGRGPAGDSLGSAVCLELAGRGFTVLAWDIAADRLAWTAGVDGVEAWTVDVADWVAVRWAAEPAAPVDVLVNCAALTRHPWAYRAFHEVTPEQLEHELRVSLLGTCYPSLAVGRLMARRRGGAIVNVSSAIHRHAAPFQLGYGAAKAGVAAFTAALAAELGPHGVRVNAVAPGLTETDVFRSLGARGRERVGRMFAGPQPIPPADVARVVGFLASDRSRAVNGQVITVDTGFDPFGSGDD